MKAYYFLTISLLCVFCLGCDKNDPEENPAPEQSYRFEDGFETTNNSLNALFPTDGSRWSTIQQTDPSGAENAISVVTNPVSEGGNALRILAYGSDSQLSKIDIEKNGLQIPEGSTVRISADFYIDTTEPLADLLLLDLECCNCWDPAVGDNYGSENQCPGVRLMMSGGNDYLSIERGKISGSTLQQTQYAFPRQQWVRVEWTMTLSATDSGRNLLVIDGQQVLDQPAMNFPNAGVFRDVFAQEGIDFTLQQPTYYERVQIGATANPTPRTIPMYVDNFSLQVD